MSDELPEERPETDLPTDPANQPEPHHFDQAPTDVPDDPYDDVDTDALEAEVNSAMAPAVAEARAAGQIPQKWDIPDYLATGNDSAAAAKLADSAVAPLVVMARGYETIHEENLAEATKRFALPRKTNAQGKRIAEAITRGDILIMPWFTHDDVVLAERSMRAPKPVTIQFRPAKPEMNDKGKELKYEFIGGQKTPIGMHPGFPTAWIDTTPVVLIAEGLLKGDSALTGYLLANGATRDDLAWTDADSTGDREKDIAAARSRLAGLLDRIDPDNRILILTVGGVHNWKNNSEWRTIEMRGRTVWLGIDGDVSTNPNVYQAASELWDFLAEKKKTTPMLIAPSVPVPDGGESEKVGIDDYLSHHGTWDGLLAMLATKLPPRPQGTNVEFIGKHRISEDGTALEVCKGVPDPFGAEGTFSRGTWEPVLPIGGRILSLVASRTPTDDEVRTGVLGTGVDLDIAPWSVEIEVAWKDDQGDKIRHTISGPADILNYSPDQWARHGAQIPAQVLRSPEWPPLRKHAEDWVRALKSNMPEETRIRYRWATMGWVPVEGSLPAFIVGEQIFGGDDNPDIDIFPGVGEPELSGATRFGFGDEDPRDLDDPTYCEEVRRDIERTLDTFVLSGAWTDRKVASTVVAAALRPAMPVRPTATIFAVGPPSKGKSWTAAMMMGFWSRKPGYFTTSSLPGSAKDTPASMELAVARSPIWVVDDLAPASSRQQSEQEQSKIADLVRNIFNGSAKRRSNADMGTRTVHTPRAMLVVTAENELQIPSARQRCITLNIGWGALPPSKEPTTDVEDLCYTDGAPSRVSQALVKYLRYTARAHPNKWPGLYKMLEDDREHARLQAAARMRASGAQTGDLRRHADMAGDVNIALLSLARLAQHVGCREETLHLLTTDGMLGDVVDLVSQGHQVNNESTPGRALVEAIAGAMFRKRAHVLDATVPGSPPGDDTVAAFLGWEVGPEGNSRPKGDTIGWLVNDEVHGEVLYLDQKAAFAVAQREYPALVPPGQGFRSSWGSVIGEGLHVKELLRARANGTLLSTGRRRPVRSGEREISGTPIRLAMLLANGDKLLAETSDFDA